MSESELKGVGGPNGQDAADWTPSTFEMTARAFLMLLAGTEDVRSPTDRENLYVELALCSAEAPEERLRAALQAIRADAGELQSAPSMDACYRRRARAKGRKRF